REMRGLKQEGLAWELGEDWTQKKVSLLEAKEEIEPAILEQVARVLKIPVEAFTDLDEDGPINIISNTFNDHAVGYARTYSPSFNPIDKVVQLYDEKIALYERMLKDKSDMIEKLERLLSAFK
ncbi:MAG TPA: XRE family transcriptional regulator, partial [Flavisolibacter sp.]|nr:XRE family transcriptional regulator [Flavisolibacter sp.]